MLQELVLGPLEYSTSILITGGEVHDAITSTYDYAEEEYVWPHVKEVTANRVATRDVVPEHLETMRAFLAEYEGICNFNYKVSDSAHMAVNWPLPVGYASVTWRLHGGYTAVTRRLHWRCGLYRCARTARS